MADRLEDLLRACTVQVLGESPGAGFFVAPGKVLTCAHVIGDSPDPEVRWERDGRPPIAARAAGPALMLADKGLTIPDLDSAYPDIAVLEVPGLDDHPCVAIDAEWPRAEDAFHVYGYPREGGAELLAPARLTYRGVHGTKPTAHLDLAWDTIKPGMSGAAVLNLRTGAVCGVIVATRHPSRSDGALAVHWSAIAEDLNDLLVANRAFHRRDRRWQSAQAACSPAGGDGGSPVRRQIPASNIPSLPGHFTPWEEPLASAKAALLDSGHSETARLVGLVGMGGVGKSVLACALARDPQVKRSFQDGVVWLSMGPEADPANCQKALAEAFGDHREGDWQLRLSRLNQLLAGASCLVIVDDVWERRQLRGLRLSQPKSALLVTARNKDILDESAIICEVRPLRAGAARELLARCVDKVPSLLPDEAEEVAHQCDGLPLALAVAGGMVKEGYGWRDLSDHLREADLPKFIITLSGYEEYDNLFLVLDASVSSLTAKDRDCYLDLAVFEDRSDVPIEMAFRLWRQAGLADRECGDLLFRLGRRSLLRRQDDTFSLHSLQFRYARCRLGEERVRELHARLASVLLDGWGGLNNRLPGLQTTHLVDPAERYGVLNLTAHLKAAGRDDEIHRLLALDSSPTAITSPADRAENTWCAVHDRLGETLAYSADIGLAANLAKVSADQAFAAAEPIAGIGLEIRYALLSASMSSITASIPPPLMVALVADGQWTAGQGLKQARLLPAAEERAGTLIGLLAYLNRAYSSAGPRSASEPPLRLAELAAEASAAASTVDEPGARASILTTLAVQLPEPDRAAVVAKAGEAVLSIRWPFSRAQALAALSADVKLPKAIQHQALELAADSHHPRSKALILTALAPQLDRSARVSAVNEAREAIDAISEPDVQARSLVALLRMLPEAERTTAARQAWQAADAIPDGLTQARIFIALAEQVTPPARNTVLNRAQETIGKISQPEEKAAALTALIPMLSSRASAEKDALAAIDMITQAEEKAAALTALTPKLRPQRRRSLIGRALDAIGPISEPGAKADALIGLVKLDNQSDYLQDKAADAIRAISQSAARAAAYTDLAGHQEPGARRSATLARALAEARAIDDPGPRATGIARLTAYLPGWENPATELDGRRAVDQAIADARAGGRPKPLAITLAGLAPALPEADRRLTVLKEAVLQAHRVHEPGGRAEAFTALLRPLPEPHRRAALREACKAAGAIADQDLRHAALSTLVSVAPDTLTHQAGEVVRTVETVLERLASLDAVLAGCGLDAEDRPTVLLAILALPALAMSSHASSPLPPLTPKREREGLFQGAQGVTAAVGDLRSQATALAIMAAASFDSSTGISGGVTAALAVAKAWSASARLPDLSGAPDDGLRASVQAIDDAHSWAAGHPPGSATVIVKRAGSGQQAPPSEAWNAAPDQGPDPGNFPPWASYWRPAIDDAARRGRTALISDLSAMGPALIHFGDSAAVQETLKALLDVGRWWP